MVVGLWSLNTPYTWLKSSGHWTCPYELPDPLLCQLLSPCVSFPSQLESVDRHRASVLDVSATSDLLVRAQRNPCHFKFYLILATSRKLEKRIRTSSSLGAALRIVTASP